MLTIPNTERLRFIVGKTSYDDLFKVFFRDEADTIAAGFRPCGNCMKAHYKLWKEGKIIPGDLEATRRNVDFPLEREEIQ